MEAPTRILYTNISLATRLRKNYTAIEELAESLTRFGTIQPIVVRPALAEDGVDTEWVCVAGGRRLSAMGTLGTSVLVHSATSVPGVMGFVLTTEISEDYSREIELEENIQRENMTWVEQVNAIAEIHKLKARQAALTGEKWGSRETGKLLNKGHVSVSYAIAVADAIRLDPELAKCDGPYQVLKKIVERKEDEVLAIRAKTLGATVAPAVDHLAEPIDEDDDAEPSAVQPMNQTIRIPLFSMCQHGDAIAKLYSLPAGSIDHIVTDPPYGIEMSNFIQDVTRVEATHGVAANEILFPKLFLAAKHVLRPSGFFVLWCDQMQWQSLYDLGIAAGFRVQRWPLTWIKTGACANQAAQYNFTKRTEIAMVCRMPNAVLANSAPENWYSCGTDKFCSNSANPFSKPLDLWQWIIEKVSFPGQIICDPFAGEGSCPVAALAIDRKVQAFELDEAHYNRMLFNVQNFFTAIKSPTTTLVYH